MLQRAKEVLREVLIGEKRKGPAVDQERVAYSYKRAHSKVTLRSPQPSKSKVLAVSKSHLLLLRFSDLLSRPNFCQEHR